MGKLLLDKGIADFEESRFAEHRKASRDIKGWLHPQAAAMMAFLLDCQKNYGLQGGLMEIGVFHGRSATLLGLYGRSDETFVLCDIVYPAGVKEEIQAGTSAKCTFLEKQSFHINVGFDLPSPEERFRFIHIDGNHSGTDITHELRLSDALLHPDGIICVDDFFNPVYPQITDAVLHYLRQNPYGLTMFLVGYNKAFLGRPTRVHPYMKTIENALPEYLRDNRMIRETLVKSTVSSEMCCFSIVQSAEIPDKLRRGPDWMRGAFGMDV